MTLYSEYGMCEICGESRQKRQSPCDTSLIICPRCYNESLERRFQNVFNQARMMVPEKELEFMLRLLVGTDENELGRAERLLQDMRKV